jgi:hypothetical protein
MRCLTSEQLVPLDEWGAISPVFVLIQGYRPWKRVDKCTVLYTCKNLFQLMTYFIKKK